MELDLPGTWEWIQTGLLPYWQVPAYILAFAFAGKLSTHYLVTDANVRWLAGVRDRLWNAGGAKRVPGALLKVVIGVPLPMHPLLVAPFLAPLPLPMPPGLTESWWHHLVLLELCAILSLGAYDLVHAVLRQRGLDFQLPGEDAPPPPDPG
jgi:hypothetical protein